MIPNVMISSGLKQVRDISRQEAFVKSEKSKLCMGKSRILPNCCLTWCWKKPGLQKNPIVTTLKNHWTIPGFLALDQESRVPLNYIFRISFFFPFFSCLSHKMGEKDHTLPGFETLYLITHLHGKRSLLQNHINDEVFYSIAGFSQHCWDSFL